jgi:hypothetical protein
MKRRTGFLVILVTVAVLLAAAGPVAGQPPHAITVSGHECVYVTDWGEAVTTGKMVHVSNLIAVGDFVSDDPTMQLSGTTTSVIEIRINWPTLHFHRTFTLVPDGADGTFEGFAVGWARFYPDGTVDPHVSGVLHGTGEFEGQSMHMVFAPGDFGRCRSDAWDTAVWTGFIVPPGQ